MFQSDKKNNMSSILGPEIQVNGDLKIKGDILIYGTVIGNVECDGKVHTSKGSLVNGNINAGIHTVTWNGFNSDGKPVSSGVYLYIIKNDSFSAMKKMILMK